MGATAGTHTSRGAIQKDRRKKMKMTGMEVAPPRRTPRSGAGPNMTAKAAWRLLCPYEALTMEIIS